MVRSKEVEPGALAAHNYSILLDYKSSVFAGVSTLRSTARRLWG